MMKGAIKKGGGEYMYMTGEERSWRGRRKDDTDTTKDKERYWQRRKVKKGKKKREHN